MRVGFVGLGTMGAAMAGRLVAAGFDVAVHNRTRAREVELAKLGAARAGSPAAAARGAELVVVIVSDTPDVDQVVFGADGVAEGLAPGALVVDMSTIAPDATRRFAAQVAARGAAWLDAPVSGGARVPGTGRCRSWSVAMPATWRVHARSWTRWARRSPTSGRSAPASWPRR